MPAQMKAKPAGEPRLGSVVVGGALLGWIEIPEGESGIPVTELAKAGLTLTIGNGQTELGPPVSALVGSLAVARIKRWRW